MKKTLLLTTACLFTTVGAMSQQLNNAGFESWTSAGAYEDPDSWTTINALSAVFGETIQVTKDSDAHAGSFSARIESANSSLLGVTGILLASDAYTFRPESIEFYYKYAGVGNDVGMATVSLTKWDAVNNVQIAVGAAELQLNDAGAFTLGTLDITYETSDVPDSMTVFFSSTDLAAPVEGSILNIDDVSVMMPSSASLANLNPLDGNTVYPNPATDKLNIVNKSKATSIEILDVSGRTVDVMTISETSTIDVSRLNEGNYLYNLKDGNKILSRGKFSVIK